MLNMKIQEQGGSIIITPESDLEAMTLHDLIEKHQSPKPEVSVEQNSGTRKNYKNFKKEIAQLSN